MIWGREEELEKLNNAFKMHSSQLVITHGRRRIGKSTLLQEFSKDKHALYFEGIENEQSKEQINNFVEQLRKQYHDDPFLKDLHFKSWHDVFYYISEQILEKCKQKQRTVLVFDEFQWMAANRGRLVSLLKYFWDNHWKDKNVMLILCGSIASFMVEKVIHSKALYGRSTLEMQVKGLKPNQCKKFFKSKRHTEEILKYLLIFGTVPKYLEIINLNQSFKQNMTKLCFDPSGYLFNEADKIFYNQFRETEIYSKIVNALKDQMLSLSEIAKKVKQSPGGGLKRYLDNLENAQFISKYIPFGSKHNTKIQRYKLTDEFLVFYYKYIEPNKSTIKKSHSKKLFEELCEKHWDSWLGFAFERFCNKNAGYLAETMGFSDEVIDLGPYFSKNDKKFQIDYLFKRSDKVIVLCEMKYHNKAISTTIIPEIEGKLKLLDIPKGYTVEKALISVNGIDEALNKSEYFHHVVTLDDLV